MNIDFECKYKLDAAFNLEEKDDKYLFTDLENGNWFRTNKAGKDYLSLFNGETSVHEIAKIIAEREGFPISVIEKQLGAFIEKAVNRKLLLPSNALHETISVEFCPYPNDLWIHVTDLCNMNCPFCYSSSGKDGARYLELDKVLRFVSAIPHEFRKNIIISGGEPLLYPELPALVQELKAMDFTITVISNGTAKNERYGEIIPYIDTLQISIDGPTEEVYSKTRGAGHFKKAISTLEYAHENGMKNIVVSFTTNNYNISSIQDMAEFAMLHHVNHLHITKIIPSGRANDIMDKIVPSALEYGMAIIRLSNAVIEINKHIEALRATDEVFLEDDEKTKLITCSFSSDPVSKTTSQTKITTCSLGCGTLSIGYDGKIYPCGCLQFDDMALGSLSDSVADVMSRGHQLGEEYSVENPAMAECYECKYKYICGGGCRACANAAGNMKGRDPMCQFFINRIESVLWDVPIDTF